MISLIWKTTRGQLKTLMRSLKSTHLKMFMIAKMEKIII
jgi:hypothetical protein